MMSSKCVYTHVVYIHVCIILCTCGPSVLVYMYATCTVYIGGFPNMYITLARNHLNTQEMIFDHYLYKWEVSSAGPTEKLANEQGYHSSYHAE